MDQLLTVKQAAALLACSEAAIRKWVYQRRLPVVKVGRLTRLRQGDLERFLAGAGNAMPAGPRPHPGRRARSALDCRADSV